VAFFPLLPVALFGSSLVAGALLAIPAISAEAQNEPTASSAASPAQDVASTLRAIVSSRRHVPLRWPRLDDVAADLASVYDSSLWMPVWSRDGQPTASARAVIDQLAMIDARGLDPADYDVIRLRELSADVGDMRLATVAAQAEFDVTLSSGVLRVLHSLRFGRVSARAAHAQLRFTRQPYDAAAVLRVMASAQNPSLQFDAAEPPFMHYHLLKGALARYRALAADSMLQRFTVRGALRPDSASDAVPAVRRLLTALGDLSSATFPLNATDSLRYDSLLVDGVRRFQQRHSLEADGVVGPATLARLRQPLSARVRQIELTLERWRWLPHDFGDPPPIVVNIPAFRVYVFTTGRDRETEILSMDVVVGQAYNHKTPVFSASLQHLIFSPFWDVPPSIARKELLPKARRDIGYLDRNHYEILNRAERRIANSPASLDAVAAGRARIRQRPGEDNALGGVKFVFPNEFNVYMHDTPVQSAFEHLRRDMSHGCIRLSKPFELAQFLLRDQPTWDATAIADAMRQETPQLVRLTRAVPVHIMYGTAVTREDGTVLFYDDIYGHDRTLTRLLAAGYPFRG